MAPNPPQNIYGPVEAVAVQYGIPASLWEDIAYVESGYNPSAVGDNGTSFGLFQLHIGGQLPAQYNSNPSAVYDPTLNAQIAMPSIAKAWNNLKGSFNATSPSWWQNFAAQSGHPGGSPGQTATNNEAARLLASYSGGSTSTTNLTSQTSGSGCTPSDPCLGCGPKGSAAYLSCLAASVNSQGTSALPACASCGTTVTQDFGTSVQNSLLAPIEAFLPGALVRIALFLFALALVVVGFLVIKQ